MTTSLPHIWIVAPYKRDLEEARGNYAQQSDVFYHVDCHRNNGGPYSGLGALLRCLVPHIQERYPQLVKRYAVEILSIAPDLHFLVPPPLETLTTLAVPQERTRFYAGDRTRRLAHGIVELLIEYVVLAKIACLELFFLRVDEADSLDQEFLAILLRRTRNQPLLIVIGTASEQPAEIIRLAVKNFAQILTASPLTMEERLALLCSCNVPASWQKWLMQQSVIWRGEWEALILFSDLLTLEPPKESTFEQGIRTMLLHCPQEILLYIAKAYVECDGSSENPVKQIAYQLLDRTIRQQLHDNRAAELEELNQRWYFLGPIAYHYERGNDPAGKGAKVLGDAINYSFDMGYYEASLDYGMRGRNILDKKAQLDQYWNFTTKMITSFMALERPEEAEKYSKEMRASTQVVSIQIQLAYTTAMLSTRHYKDQRRNHHLAKEWIQVAIALTHNLQEVSYEERAFIEVFNMNALALIEMNLGHPEIALQLLAEGLARMDRELGPDAHQLHRSVFLHNRGQVYARVKQYELALEAFTYVIDHDPYYSEYYFDRADVYQQLHRYKEALEDYNKAIFYSPPYFEAYYNRATIFSLMGQDNDALADYTYVLELEPTFDLASINRVGILYEQGRYDDARRDIVESLIIHPKNPQLLCTLGLVEMAEQHQKEAYQAFTSALKLEPSLHEAWSNRAVLDFERGNVDAAIKDLTHALELRNDATVLYNRGFAYQSQKRWRDAIADYNQAFNIKGADKQELLYQRALCYFEECQEELGWRDLEAHLNMGASAHIEEIRRLAPSVVLQESDHAK